MYSIILRIPARKLWLFVFAAGIIFPSLLISQISNYRFEHIGVAQGLSHALVYDIMQDKDGFLWIGTQDGLNRYDGYDFKVYRYDPADKNSISNSSVSTICQDNSGNIWVGTWGGGLNKYDPFTDSFIRYMNEPGNANSLSSDRVPAILQDSKNRLWIGTAGGGLDLFIPGQDKFIHFRHDDKNPNGSLSHDRIWGLTEDKDGNLWIATENGVTKFNYDKSSYKIYRNEPGDLSSLSHSRVRSVFCDSDGIVWIGTEKGLNKYDKKNDRFITYFNEPGNPESLSFNIINCIYEDNNHNILVGTYGGGLSVYDKKKNTFTNFRNEPDNYETLNHNDVRCIAIDNSNITWIGTRGGGLDKFSNYNTKFKSLTNDSKNEIRLNDKTVRAISDDRSGNLWIGTNEGGLNRFNRKENKAYYYREGKGKSSISSSRVVAIEVDEDGIVWLGTDGGLNKFEPSTNSFTVYRNSSGSADELSHNQIVSMYDDKKGNLWIGTYGGGLNKFNKSTGKFTHFKHDASKNSISDNEAVHIIEDHKGYLWIATSNGLNRFNTSDNTFKVFKTGSSGISSNHLWSVYEDKDGIIWIGSSVGLNKFDPVKETFKYYTRKDGLPNNVVYGILPDNSGNLWLSTNNGLSKFNPAKETFRNYDEGDGLLSSVFYQGAFYRNTNGELFFGSIQGLNYFVPEEMIENNSIPDVQITGFSVFQDEVDAKGNPELFTALNKGKIELGYNENFITINFTSLDFTNPPKNKFMYMLSGVDKEWIDAGSRRYANYTNLDPGNYTFIVKAANSDGVWNTNGASLKIIIAKPFWQTWWFISIALFIVFTSIYLGYQTRVKNLKSRQKELLKLIEERKAVEEELRLSRERYELAVQGSSDGLWDWKVGTDNVFYSERWKELLGYHSDEIKNKLSEFEKRIHPDDKTAVLDAINAHVERNEKFDIEFRMETKEGDYKWFRSRGGSVRDRKGKSIRMSGSTTDISERKKIEMLNRVLYNISRVVNTTENSEDLFPEIHKQLSEIFDTKNFFVALYNWEKDEVSFPYFIDELDEPFTIVNASNSDSLTVQIVKSGKPLFLSEEDMINRRKASLKPYWGSLSKCWIGVPLKLKEKIIGAIALQSYTNPHQFSPGDIPILSIIAEQVAIAIDRKWAENALKESEVRFRALIENSSDIIFILDETGENVKYSSPSVERILGFESKELILEPDKFNIHPEDVEIVRHKIKEIISNPGELIIYEFRIKNKDGNWKYFEAAGTNLLDNTAVNGIVINLRDITERKSAEDEIQNLNLDLERRIDERTSELTVSNMKLQNEIKERMRTLLALKESEERTRLVIDTALDAVVSVDADSKIIRWNSRAEHIFGWTKEEAAGKTLMDTVIPPEYHDAHRSGMKRFIETGQGRIINTLVEISASHKDGHRFPVELAISNIRIDGNHTFSAFIRDITERKKQEEKLRASEEKYRLLIENASEAILIAQEGFIVFANPTSRQLSGYTFQELSSIPFINLVYADDRPTVMERYKRRIMGDTELQNYEFRIVHKSGRLIIVEINAILIMWEGKPATLNFLADITERKKAEEEIKLALVKEKELNELKSRFVSMASHEFRTPLTSILGSAEIIERYGERLTEDKKLRNLHRIQENVKHMTHLLDDILIIGKSDAGKLDINPEPVNLNSLCEQVIEQFEIQLSGKNNHTIKYSHSNIDREFFLDPKLMKQILENLVSNAIKYSPGGGEIMLNIEADNDNIFIKIKDSGLGIPPDDVSRLFEPFHRAKNVGSLSGTGLGLSIVKRGVEIHGGNISVESVLGEGTLFNINIPVKENIAEK